MLNEVKISRSTGGYSNTALTEWAPDTPSLVKELSTPTIGSKDGSYFIRCPGTKRNNADTADIARVLILDGDSRIDDDGEIKAGAPSPADVHEVLTRLGVSHLIYSSHSNGATREELSTKSIDSGGMYDNNFHKYRVVITCTYTPEQLPVLLDYLFNELHRAGVMLVDVKENRSWSQPWYFPRIPDAMRLALFEFYHHDGVALDVETIHKDWLNQQPEPEEPKYKDHKPQPNENIKGWRNPIQAFNQAYTVHDVLIRNGYVKKGLKYLRPDSESKIPGVQLCLNCKDGIERVYSHGCDALNDGFAHDAFDCMRLLEHGGVW